jgi:hypothetical protein
MKRVIDALREYGELGIIDQTDLEKRYGITWEDVNEFLPQYETHDNLISDRATEEGFEEVIWEFDCEGTRVRDTTIYGIGSFTNLEVI